MNQAVQTWRSHSEKGGVLDESYLSTHETSNARDIIPWMTSASLKGEEDLSDELFRLTLAFSLEGGGVLYEPTSPLTRPLTQGKQVPN